MGIKEKIKKITKEYNVVILLCICMAVYYACKMFINHPWYDELYTYYSFISRGPVYAAIHWPVPNNHVFYSVLSACLNIFQNATISLRGISFIAAVVNLFLVFLVGRKFTDKYLSCACAMIYASVYLVNSLSVQGRGYTLATTCYLLSVIFLYRICCEKEKRIDYIGFALSLTAGLYTLVSSTFWVVPICIIGGAYLLFHGEYRKMWKLIATSLAAAAMTFFLYTIIWLAIGANLLSKDATSGFYEIYQVTIILKRPFLSLQTGMQYMLSTPYVQSIGRLQTLKELPEYLSTLFDQYFQGMGACITLFLAVILVILLSLLCNMLIRKGRKNTDFFLIYFTFSLFFLPLMLLIQSVQPYKRVFSYWAVPFSLLLIYCIHLFIQNVKTKEKRNRITCFISVLSLLLLTGKCLSPDYRTPYAGRENQIREALEQANTEKIERIFYTDDFQKYVLKFYCDLEPEETQLSLADTVIIPCSVLENESKGMEWPDLVTKDMLDLTYIQQNFELTAETDSYLVYQREE